MKKPITPFVHAEQFVAASLYWAPAPAFPMPERHARWYLAFFAGLADRLAMEKIQLELLLHQRFTTEGPLARIFRKHQNDDCPIPGLGRRPGKMPQTATLDDISEVQKGRKAFSWDAYSPDILYWFLDRDLQSMWQRYFGQGGALAIGIEPDPATKPPEIPKLRVIEECKEAGDLERRMKQAYALQHPFLKKSVEVFAADLRDSEDDRFEHMPFVLPMLSSNDFFTRPAEVQSWFDVFKLYIAESKTDGGVIMATVLPLEPLMADTLESLRAGGLQFPEL